MTNAYPITVHKILLVTDEDIDTIMSCALDGGITYWCDKVACKSVQGEELLKYPEREWDFTGYDAEFSEFVREVEFSLTCRTPDALKRKVIDAIADALIARVC